MKTAVYKLVFLGVFIVVAILLARHFGMLKVGTPAFYVVMGAIGIAAGVTLRGLFGREE